mmetsp:Transcript_12294/g.27690  ORF Transcript_12294/g.27690 Transcript_12294/m.27690 type:complete len:220 (+) Transcript_12294:372-1031(+)
MASDVHCSHSNHPYLQRILPRRLWYGRLDRQEFAQRHWSRSQGQHYGRNETISSFVWRKVGQLVVRFQLFHEQGPGHAGTGNRGFPKDTARRAAPVSTQTDQSAAKATVTESAAASGAEASKPAIAAAATTTTTTIQFQATTTTTPAAATTTTTASRSQSWQQQRAFFPTKFIISWGISNQWFFIVGAAPREQTFASSSVHDSGPWQQHETTTNKSKQP